MSADPHFGFIAAAYLLGFLVIAGMIAAILTDYASLKRALAKFAAGDASEGSSEAASRRPARREASPAQRTPASAEGSPRQDPSP